MSKTKSNAKNNKNASESSEEELIQPGRVKRLVIQNFRAIGKNPVTIDLEKIVVLVGPNNVGKSSILRAYEAIMQDGSKEGHLNKEDFPNGEYKAENPTTIELHTVATKFPPSSKWVTMENDEAIVKERWVWRESGVGKRQGWNNQLDGGAGWDELYPWGPANVAKARRPQPHWVKAFDAPEVQGEEINSLITSMVADKAKQIPAENGELKEDGSPKTEFEILLQQLHKFQEKAFDLTKSDVKEIEKRLTDMVAEIFANHVINFSLYPPDDKGIKLFATGSNLSVGLKDGYKGPLKNQGSGARRTILWAVLRVLSEQKAKTSERPRFLLIDEPELCLHPDAIREACRVLYDLAENAGWQVMVTTHSPVFIDLSRDNTTVVRVERSHSGDIKGTTLYRPATTTLGNDDRDNLKILNIYDPYVAEFFFGGRVIVVEGDTEYSAFKYLISEVAAGKIAGATLTDVSNLQIIRARGKATIVSLCKILNHFGTSYSILHDTDIPEVTTKDGGSRKNPAWTINRNILNIVSQAPFPERIRVLASVKNFENAFLGIDASKDKPYNAIRELSQDAEKLKMMYALLIALIDHTRPIPSGAVDAKQLKEDDIKKAA